MAEPSTLRVAVTSQDDIGLGTARLDAGTRSRLKVSAGDVVEIRGGKTTAAVVSPAQPDDEGANIVRIEALVRWNAGVKMGDQVRVQRIECPIAESMTLAPIYSGSAKIELPGIEPVVSQAVTRRPFVLGDAFLIQGVFHARNPLPFLVVSTSPSGIVQVGPSTKITVRAETVQGP